MTSEKEIGIGDWVRFYRGGQLMIAEVRYVRAQMTYPYQYEALTDHGAVTLSDVIEARSAAMKLSSQEPTCIAQTSASGWHGPSHTHASQKARSSSRKALGLCRLTRWKDSRRYRT